VDAHRRRGEERAGEILMEPRELVVVSGKGGTGKTSVVAAFAALAGTAVLADCDVDAADLHLVLQPELGEPHEFSGRSVAVVDADACIRCGRCAELCRFAALSEAPGGHYVVDGIACEGCAICTRVCPADAVRMEAVVNGAWMVSRTRFGPLVHAQLGIAEDNSGKLVTLVRKKARETALQEDLPLVIADGSPGIGCPVIASLAGADLVLAVTEPTISGRHDLDRLLQVVRGFRLPFAVLVNKADLNQEAADTIAAGAHRAGALFVTTVDYDPAVTEAQVAGRDVITHGGLAAKAIEATWSQIVSVIATDHETRTA
jgi:MinD superfamily P-loop ATPase